jgi:hypothetical protein
MTNGINSVILKAIFLSLITVSTLTSVYYLNIDDDEVIESEYLKSDICYYSLNGIKSDYHYHFNLNITINNERSEIPMNLIVMKPVNLFFYTLYIHMITAEEFMLKLQKIQRHSWAFSLISGKMNLQKIKF